MTVTLAAILAIVSLASIQLVECQLQTSTGSRSLWSSELATSNVASHSAPDYEPLKLKDTSNTMINNQQQQQQQQDPSISQLMTFNGPQPAEWLKEVASSPIEQQTIGAKGSGDPLASGPLINNQFSFADSNSIRYGFGPVQNFSTPSARWPLTSHWTTGNLSPIEQQQVEQQLPSVDRIDQLASEASTNSNSNNYLLLNQLINGRSKLQQVPMARLSGAQDSSSLVQLPEQLQQAQAILRHLLAAGRTVVPLYAAPGAHLAARGPWLRAVVGKRRASNSYELPMGAEAIRSPRLNFDEPDPAVGGRSLPTSDSGPLLAPELHSTLGGKSSAKRDYLASLASIPLFITESAAGPAAPPQTSFPHLPWAKNAKLTAANLDDELDGYVTAGPAGGKFSPSASHHAPHYFGGYLPAAGFSGGHHKVARKGLEKSLALPILVGIGAGLISFLIISNLFLSIPLFAMTLFQLLGGNNNMLMPNNAIPTAPSNNNQPTNGQQQTALGRKRRDLTEFGLEERVSRAFEQVPGRY